MEINRIFGQQMTQSYQQRTARTAQGSSFQEILQAQGAAASTQARQTSTVTASDNTTILPTDSVEVKLEKLKKIGETADYTGMSYSEIYTTIWNRYNDAFDGNLSAILSEIWATPDNWCDISNQFSHEAYQEVFQPLHQEFEEQGKLKGGEFYDENNTFAQCVSDIRSAPLGYSGMSFAEKEQAIYEKYKGKDTYIDFLNMQGELRSTGVYENKLGMEGESNYFFVLNTRLTYNYLYPKENVPLSTSNPEWTDAQWNRILHEKFDANSFLKEVKQSLSNVSFQNGYQLNFDMESVISEQIEELIHATEREEESQKL